ncbi:hypothetical protein KP509_38G034800 [Ceratopteris richardii]|uniref:Mechanosensitive ion channel MscS domain-containing protein n=1 Tax=Ceratopteris richardii TaxID=49495 RepID=A0A8T2Q3S2_CERRI|nr:hypothetical protein KP509_38G034800 [Ceratopteris richardii]
MNPADLHEVIVRVENRAGAESGSNNCAHLESVQFRRSPSPVTTNGRLAQNGGVDSRTKESRSWEERNDAIWEEFASPDSGQAEADDVIGHTKSSRRSESHLSFDCVSAAAASSGAAALRRDSELRHRSLDLDIHLHEPNLVMLQEHPPSIHSKPFSGPLPRMEPSSDSRVNTSEAKQSPPRVVRTGNAAHRTNGKLPPSPLQPRSSVVDKEDKDEESALLHPKDIAPSWRSDSKSDKLEVKLQLQDVHVKPVRTKQDDEGRRSAPSSAVPSATNSPVKAMKQPSLRTVTLSKELLKTKTKSRLLEPPSPAPTAGAVSARRFGSIMKSGHESPARVSTRRAEADAEDEDPFKDIDVQDEFRQGNLKPITLAQWVAFFIVIGLLVCSLTVRQLKSRQIWGLELWKWFLLVLVVLCGRLVSGWIIRIMVITLEKNFLLRKKVLYFVYGIRRGAQNLIWLGLVLLAWKLMFDPRVERSKTNHKALVVVTKLLLCLVIAAFIWLVKLLLMKSLASSFHVATFFDRIQESLFNQHVLETLSGPPLLDLAYDPFLQPSSIARSLGRGPVKDPEAPTEPAITIQHLQKMNTKNVSAGVMKRLMNLVKHPGLGTLMTTIDESVGVIGDSEDIAINSELEAKAAAKCIFKNVARQGSRFIESEDLLRFFPANEVPQVLCLFEGARDTGKITKKALKIWVVNVYQERKALALSLNDTKTAVKELHRMVTVLVIVIIIVVWLLVLGIATTHVLLFITSQLLLVGFMFSNTVKQIFEAIIFLFVMHPFDVGDRCIVDGQQLIVEEMKILTTVFLKPDNEKVYYPNSVLATKCISNLYRSPDMMEFLQYSVHISTPTEKINTFKEKLTEYVERNPEHWRSKITVIVKELEDLNSMALGLSLQHTINFQNAGERFIRRSALLLEIKRIFSELGVEYRLLPQTIELAHPSTKQSIQPFATPLPPLYPVPHQLVH